MNNQDIFYFNLDDLKLRELFATITNFIHFIGKNEDRKYIFIDEIQRLENPGLILKEIYDLNLNIKIIYSGSSQLEIKSKLKEYLVGRVRQFEIHRLSFEESIYFSMPNSKEEVFNNSLLYGSYPEITLETASIEKKLSIKDIFQNYIQKDIIEFMNIKNIEAFNKLLIICANQIGNLFNFDSIAKKLRIQRKLIEEYMLILEGTFIIKRIYPFHKNYSKEIVKTPRLYFMDIGLRNYIINNFNDLSMRTDRGALFENFYLLELLKADHYQLNKINFWRTTNQTEIDFIITGENMFQAIEVKWGKDSEPKSFKSIKKYYPDITTNVVSNKLYL